MNRFFPWLLLALSGWAAAHGTGHDEGGALPVSLGLAVLTLLYALGLAVLWRRAGVGRGVAMWRTVAFFAGIAVLAVALLGLDGQADESFTWHMVQHLLLITLAAPLLVLGTPLYVLAWAAPLAWRRAFAHLWNRRPALRRAVGWLTHPVVVWVLATAVFWAWHVPAFYEAAVRNPGLHALEHLSFLLTNALFWWALLQPPGRRALARGAAVVSLFGAALQGSLLGVLLAFARTPLYPDYAQKALAEGRNPLADQQLAGLVMWVPSGVVYVALAAVFFVQWLRDEERAQRNREPRPAREHPEGAA
ncbi:cytochrome c oxidase assembly protein [Deinococcus aluminii]|uniref:Uncharacterized protein Rv0102 n=1 Tax=Deinococcus aluminii TaxID=1656885 RepID=A0ABP9XGZ8_9DEIO